MAMGGGMGSGGGMNGGMGMMSPPPSDRTNNDDMGMRMMHMTFFWGKHVEILFSGWPGSQGLGMYLLALFFVFTMSALVECLSAASRRLTRPTTTDRVSAGIGLTALHAVRMLLAYMVMLSVMSFNVGVLVVAVAGHGLGFLVSGSGTFKWARPIEAHRNHPNNNELLPSTKS